MQAWLIQFGAHHAFLVYIPVVVVAMLEGPFLSIIFGVLLRLGYFSFLPIYAALMIGDLIGDIGWYYIGYHYGRKAIHRFGERFGVTEEKVEKVEKLFHQHKNKILFTSKITNGFGFALAVLMTAGIAKIPFKRYITINFLGQMIWSGLLLAVGYFFGESYIRIESVTGKLFLVLGVFALGFLVFHYSKNIKRKLEK